MKLKKRLLFVVMSMLLMLANSLTFVQAVGNGRSIKIENPVKGHIYEAYQIFSGDKEDTGDNLSDTLKNVQWGSGVNDVLKEKYNAVEFANLMNKNTDDIDRFIAEISTNLTDIHIDSEYNSVNSNYIISKLPTGFYLIVDKKDDNGDDVLGDVFSKNLVEVVSCCAVDIKLKGNAPTVLKKVKENIKKVERDEKLDDGYNDVADYCIGEKVPFELIGTLPSNLSDYKKYKYYFHDELSNAFDYDENSISIQIDNKNINDNAQITYNNHKLTVGFDNLKTIDGVKSDSVIKIKYTATLNSNAHIGQLGNENTVKLEYSNNPNADHDESTGYTPNDTVIVYTYELDGQKIDALTNVHLSGAKFKLYRMNGLEREYANLDREKVIGWGKNGDEFESNEDGKFVVSGLDDGKYFLEETQAPTGYKVLNEPVKFIITAKTNNTQNWNEDPITGLESISITIGDNKKSGNVSKGIIKVEVGNISSVMLPSTGSKGTILSLTFGALLIVIGILYKIKKENE
jgi:fimbrial isopeptide formation D2 family protein/LPXTG-motif cell wall-anchored protein